VTSFFTPFLGLEETFGSGFTSGSIADAIRVAEQNESSVFDFGIFAVDGINVGNLAFDVFQGLFLVSDPLTGQITHQGATQAALRESIERSRLLGLVGPTGPQGLPAPPVDLAAIIRAVTGVVGSLNREPTTGRGLPGEPVLPGGTVNVPVVLGSTGDPRGKSRPKFPDDRQNEVEIARQIGVLIRQILAARAAQRAAERRAEANAAQRQLWLNFFAQLQGGQQMGFGQSGFIGVGSGVGGAVGDLLIQLAGSVAGGLIGSRFGDQLPQLPGQQPAFPAAPGIPGLQGGGAFGGGGACPSLFRAGAGAMRVSPVPWFPIQAPNGKWFFFGHLGTPTFSKLKGRRRHHHHSRKR